MPRSAIAPCVVLVLTLVGCQSAEKSYESAQKAEAEGRWAAAADWYIDALRRQADYPGAADGLRNAGNKAITGFLNVATDLEKSGRHDEATKEYQRTDTLVKRAAGVRVALTTPSGYTQRRRATYDRVIENTLQEADRLAAAGKWREAEAAYRRAGTKLQPSERQQSRARAGRYAALMTGANQEMNAGRYDEALTIADRAASVYGPESPKSKDAVALRERIADARYQGLLAAAEDSLNAGRYQEAFQKVEDALEVRDSAEARALRDRIIDAGTMTFVPLPVWRTERIGVFLSPTMLQRTSDLLRQERWDKPPLFFATPGDVEVRRELRRFEFDREILSDRRAAAVGVRLRGAYTVVLYLDQFAFEPDGDGEAYRVATRDGAGADITVYRGRALRARCAFRIVRVRDGRLVTDGAVRASAARRIRHATYEGDMRDLLMTQEENRWFDERRLRSVDGDLEEDVAAKLVDGIGDEIYKELARLLP